MLEGKKTVFTNNDIKDTDKNTTIFVLEYLGLGKNINKNKLWIVLVSG